MPTTPTLGYGQRGEAPINAVNQWMRAQPWYQQLLTSWGQSPSNVHLNDAQKQQVIRAAQANGVVVDEGHDGQQIDDSGNFEAKGHGLRNTLIVAGLAGAALLTAGAAGAFAGAASGGAAAGGALPAGVTLEGTAAGLGGASTAVGGGLLASSATVPTVGGLAAGGAGLAAGGAAPLATYGLGTSMLGGLAPGLPSGASYGAHLTGLSGGAAAGLSGGDLLRYGLPVAGNLIGGLIQAKASGSASDAQQRYLEEALAYQKEQDTYKRGVDATAVQYGYDSDAYARDVNAAAVTREATRYGDYQGRIAPWIANGVNSNDRMAGLLGLPARAASAWGDGTRGAPGGPDAPGPAPVFRGGNSGPPASQGIPRDAATDAAVDAALKSANSSDDPEYWKRQIAAHGDSSTKNWQYWNDFIHRGDGVGKGYRG